MKALTLTAPFTARVEDVPAPVPAPGEVLVDVDRVGVCGTDVEFFQGTMAYVEQGHAHYPMRLGHEWSGRVSAVGADVDPRWIGRRVMGDTMLGCGHCELCRRGHQHVCEQREEVGIRADRDGALAEQIATPARSLHELPETIDPVAGAMVEPGANALRAARAAAAGAGDRVLVIGPGTIGLLAAMFLRADGAEVHLLGEGGPSHDFARSLGFENVWTRADLPDLPFHAVVNAASAPGLPAFALERVQPAGRVVLIGLSDSASPVDTRDLTIKDVTAVGILSASPALADTVRAYAEGVIDPRPLVAGTVGLDAVADLLAGTRPTGAGPGPKILVDPRR